MKTILAPFLLAICLPGLVMAARLFPCASYSPNGQPQDVNSVWEIPASGASVYFLHRTENSPRELPQSFSVRWRPLDGSAVEFKDYDRIYNYTEAGPDWMVFDFSFTLEGIYECSTLNEAGQPMATAIVTINRQKDAVVGKALLTACRDVSEVGDPVGPGIDFKMAPNGSIYAHFATENAFNSNKIGFEIWSVNDFGYETLQDTRVFDCSANWNFFKMPVNFPEAGRYRIKVYLGENNANILAEQMVRIQF